ncbi:hypothetical protein [Bdellovibrio sp. ArHS]|uniref:hypothetical protein n=1 Tax=Bdellovibrio sp. ArHS TaxID=1569284 RepID=UPI000A5DE61D|nr:hypothetical protein [Bdellovibrio sp. ArHS]
MLSSLEASVLLGAKACLLSQNVSSQKADELIATKVCSTEKGSNLKDISAVAEKINEQNNLTVAEMNQAAKKKYQALLNQNELGNWERCFTDSQSQKSMKDYLAKLSTELPSDSWNSAAQSKTVSSDGGFWERGADMDPMAKTLISGVAGAALWRMRGGGFFRTGNTQVTRLLSTAGFAALGAFNGGRDGLIAGALMFPSMTLGYWHTSDSGRDGDRSKWTEIAIMSGRGVLQTSLGGAYLWSQGYGPGFLASGAAMGPCYGASWQAFKNKKVMPEVGFIDGPTSMGEVCSGAAFGLGLAATLNYGKK